MKYKIGDKVKIRSDLNTKSIFNFGVTPEMLPFAGKECTICRIEEIEGITEYILQEARPWSWSDVMFEDLAEENKQEEIPYINAEEARKLYNENKCLDALRRKVYNQIKEEATGSNKTYVGVDEFDYTAIKLMMKELTFKGFNVRFITDYRNENMICVSW